MLKTSIIYFLIRGVNGAMGLGAIYVLTRMLTAEQYGLYALGMAGIGLIATMSFQWIAVSVSRFYAAHSVDHTILLSEANRLFLGAGVLVLLGTALLATLTPLSAIPSGLSWAIGLGAIAMGWHNLRLQIANARGQPYQYGLLTTSRNALALGCGVLLVNLGLGGIGALYGGILAWALSGVLFVKARQTGRTISNPALRKQLMAFGMPLTLASLATVVLDFSDRFIIGWILGPSSVAAYAAAYDLTQQTVGAVLNIFLLATYPRITAAWEAEGAPAARKAMRPLTNALLITTPLLVGIFIAFASDIANFFFGVELRQDATRVIPWVATAIAIGCLKNYTLDTALQLAMSTHIQLIIAVLTATINVVLNWVLIPIYGVVGAAVATTLAFAIGACLSWFHGRKLNVYPCGWVEIFSMVLASLALVAGAKLGTRFNVPSVFNNAAPMVTGFMSYGFVILITNLGGVRSHIFNSVGSKKLESMV